MTHLASDYIVDRYIHILNECRTRKSLGNAKGVYVDLCSQGLEAHRALKNYIVPLFVKCGCISSAQQAFDRLLCQNEHSWIALITGYAEFGCLELALDLYIKMQKEAFRSPNPDLSPNPVLSLLKASAQLANLEIGQKVHVEALKNGLASDIFVSSTLVDMYASCGVLEEAQDVFDELPVRDIVAWNALIAGYADNDLGREALYRVEQLRLDGFSANSITFVSGLKSCTSIGDIGKGQELYSDGVRKGFEGNRYIINTLVDMFSSWGLFADACDVFDRTLEKNTVTWNALISGYIEHGCADETLHFYQQMLLADGAAPDAVTYVCCLKACAKIGNIYIGQNLHAQLIKQELERSAYVITACVDMYAKCGYFAEAQDVLSTLPIEDVTCWNAFISGLAEHGACKEVLSSLHAMHLKGVVPNSITYVLCMKACSAAGAIEKGMNMHVEIIKKGFEGDELVGNTLVDMYGTRGLFLESQYVFDELSVKNVVSWNSLISGYAENGFADETLAQYEHMKSEGVPPNTTTFVSRLSACGAIGAIGQGREIHKEIIEDGFVSNMSIPIMVKEWVFASTALIDMYGKCGTMCDAEDVFAELVTRHLVSWNALLSGYSCCGESRLVVELFESMRHQRIRPDAITYLSVLNACCHTGSLSMGQKYFKAMGEEHGIAAMIKHYNCMVDVLCRAGQFGEALSVVATMSLQPDQVTWNILSSSCQDWGSSLVSGSQAFELVYAPMDSTITVFALVSNMHG